MKLMIRESPNEDKIIQERETLMEQNPTYTCAEALMEIEEYKEKGTRPNKFPIYCRNCWKVLVFDLTEVQAKELKLIYNSKYTTQLSSEPTKTKYLVVIYTKSRDERDKTNKELKSQLYRTAYRFACRSIQDDFPEMFISASAPNQNYL